MLIYSFTVLSCMMETNELCVKVPVRARVLEYDYLIRMKR